MARKTENLTLRGQGISIYHLKKIMTGSQANVVNRIMFCLQNSKNLIYGDGDTLYVQRTLKEWINDLEIWYDNGKHKKVGKSTISAVFKVLVNSGILMKHENNTKTPSYTVNESLLAYRLSKKVPGLNFNIDFEENDCRYNSDMSQLSRNNVEEKWKQNRNNLETKWNIKPETKWDNNRENLGIKWEQSRNKIEDEHVEKSGIDGIFASDTYTNTSTYTNNKSYKSKDSDLREKITIKKQKMNSNLQSNLQQNETENLFQYNKSDKSNKSISEEDKFIKNSKKGSGCSDQKSTIVQDMFAIWQDEFPLLEELLNLEKSRWLKSSYDSVFSKDLEEFRLYLRRVKTSKFIVEKPHLLNMKWLLDFDQISEIRAGNYTTCDPDNPSLELRNFTTDWQWRIEAKRGSWISECVRMRILQKLGPHLYALWFGSLHMDTNNSGELECMDFYSNHKPNATNYARKIGKEIQAEIYANCQQIKSEETNETDEYIKPNIQNQSNDEIVKIDLNQFCKTKTLNPRPPAPLPESQISLEVAEKIMEIWNASIKEKYRENLNEEKTKILNEVFVNSFDKDYKQVEEFMETLKRTMVFRTRPYMPNVLWILNADTIRQIRGGFFEFTDAA